MEQVIVVRAELCTGCRDCELACSVRQTGTFNPSRSRVQVMKDETTGTVLPVLCLQCDVPLCRQACPVGALVEGPGGALTVREDRCIGCGSCVTACVYGGIELDPKTRLAVKCDLCGDGPPACVAACEYGALELQERDRGLVGRLDGVRTVMRAYGVGEEAVRN